jgi:hypothetical protein
VPHWQQVPVCMHGMDVILEWAALSWWHEHSRQHAQCMVQGRTAVSSDIAHLLCGHQAGVTDALHRKVVRMSWLGLVEGKQAQCHCRR